MRFLKMVCRLQPVWPQTISMIFACIVIASVSGCIIVVIMFSLQTPPATLHYVEYCGSPVTGTWHLSHLWVSRQKSSTWFRPMWIKEKKASLCFTKLGSFTFLQIKFKNCTIFKNHLKVFSIPDIIILKLNCGTFMWHIIWHIYKWLHFKSTLHQTSIYLFHSQTLSHLFTYVAGLVVGDCTSLTVGQTRNGKQILGLQRGMFMSLCDTLRPLATRQNTKDPGRQYQ